MNKWIAGTNYLLTYGPGARTGPLGSPNSATDCTPKRLYWAQCCRLLSKCSYIVAATLVGALLVFTAPRKLHSSQYISHKVTHKCLVLCLRSAVTMPTKICGRFLQRAQCSHCKRCISYSNSVRLSVTRRYCVKTTARSTMQFSPLDSKMCLVL